MGQRERGPSPAGLWHGPSFCPWRPGKGENEINLDTISHSAVIASLGASCFIVFTMPRARMSRPRFLIGGHVVGVAAGCVGRWLCAIPALARLPVFSLHSGVLCGALAVGLAIFVMVITDTEHPPAAGLALGKPLQRILEGLRGEDALAGLPAEFRPPVEGLLRRIG
jgi:hypothetical protein